jgi:hypothetical protein
LAIGPTIKKFVVIAQKNSISAQFFSAMLENFDGL